MRRPSVAALAVCVAASAAAAKDVPAEMIRGRTLVYGEEGALIVAPAANWQWTALGTEGSEKSRMDVYKCQNTMDVRQEYFFSASRLPVSETSLAEKDMDEFVSGFGKSIPGKGRWSFVRPDYEPSDIPFPGSYHYKGELVSAGATVYVFGYIGLRGRVYMTLCVALDPEEPPEFVKFSSSITAPKWSRASRGGAVLSAVLFVGLCIALFVHRRNKRREAER